MRFPIVIGLGLTSDEAALVRLWGAPHHLTVPDRVDPARLGTDFSFFEEGTERLLAEILEWCLPVLVVVGAEKTAPAAADIWQAGAAAVWQLPAPGKSILFPPALLPNAAKKAVIVSDDASMRSRLRQILRFAGIDARTDLRSAVDIAEVAAAGNLDLVLVDLDDGMVDHHLLFHRMRLTARERRLRVLAFKDFQKPGFDPRVFSAEIRPLTRRVFHPDEVCAVLAEAFFLHPHRTLVPDPRMQSLDDFLIGEETVLPGRPSDVFPALSVLLEHLAPAVPFFWAFDRARNSVRGAVLQGATIAGT